VNGSCHCGQVSVSVPDVPGYMNACNCSLCLKLGALWAYYPRDAVRVEGERRAYLRNDVVRPKLSVDFCTRCGATIDWLPANDNREDRMAVNMRLFDPAALIGVQVIYGDRRNHADPSEAVYRKPTIFDGAGAKP
jgi:hypothetical protein